MRPTASPTASAPAQGMPWNMRTSIAILGTGRDIWTGHRDCVVCSSSSLHEMFSELIHIQTSAQPWAVRRHQVPILHAQGGSMISSRHGASSAMNSNMIKLCMPISLFTHTPPEIPSTHPRRWPAPAAASQSAPDPVRHATSRRGLRDTRLVPEFPRLHHPLARPHSRCATHRRTIPRPRRAVVQPPGVRRKAPHIGGLVAIDAHGSLPHRCARRNSWPARW